MAAVAIGGIAQADAPATVLLVRVSGDEAIASRLLAELHNGEWHVVERGARSSEARRALESLARASGASAALRARPTQLSVELWVAPAKEHEKSASEEVSAGPRADVGVLALRVTEVLRARGLQPTAADSAVAATAIAAPAIDPNAPAKRPSETANAPNPAPPSAATPASVATPSAAAPPSSAGSPASAAAPSALPTPPAPTPVAAAPSAPTPSANPTAAEATPTTGAKAPERATTASDSEPASTPEADEAEVEVEEPAREPAAPPLLSLEIAPALLLNPGGLNPRFDGFGNLRLRPLPMFSFSAFLLAPILQSPARNQDGRADVRTLAAGGGADLQLPFSFWEFSAGLGAAALLTWVQGHASAGFSARDQTLRTAAVLARIGLSYQLSAGVRLSSRVLVGFAIPQLRVKFGDDTIARWGEPFLVGTLGVDLNLL